MVLRFSNIECMVLVITRRPSLVIGLVTLAVLALMTATGCYNQASINRDNTIVIAFSNEPNRLNPVFLSDLTSFTLSGWIFNGLTKLADDLNVVGDLAESWSVSRDGLTITFRLRKGVLWHDGKELTSKDVLFTFNAIMTPHAATPRSHHFGPVRDIHAIDPYTIEVDYKEPYGSALISWSIGIVPAHVLQNSNMDLATFDRSPVGTGPYRLREWISGEKIVFEAFDRCFLGSPKIKKVVVRILPDAVTRLLELKKGNIDMMELTPLQFAKQTDNNSMAVNYEKYRTPSFRYAFFGFNLLDERFRDKRVRDAIDYGIDKDALISSVLFGYGSRSTGPYPPSAWYGSPEAPYVNYDPTKAIQLLQEAGWHKGSDGLLTKKRVPFSFTLFTNYESEENSKIAQILQNNLQALGIEVKINQLEWQTFRHDVINRRAFDTVILSRAYMWDPDLYDLWHSSKSGEGEWNFLSYKSARADTLLEKGRKTLNLEQRRKIYQQFHEVLAEERPCIFLYNADGLFISHRRIRGINASPQGIYQNVNNFFISR